MVKVRSTNLKKSQSPFKKAGLIFGSSLMIAGMVSCGGGGVEVDTTEVLDPTQGVVTEVKEIETDLFRITNEDIVSTKEDSRIIAEYIDGVRDTFTLEEAQLVDAEGSGTRRSSMNGILMGGLMGYMMGKSMSTPINSGAYANQSAYQKSNTKNTSLRSTATRKTVTTPKKGFGGSKSSRSYGG